MSPSAFAGRAVFTTRWSRPDVLRITEHQVGLPDADQQRPFVAHPAWFTLDMNALIQILADGKIAPAFIAHSPLRTRTKPTTNSVPGGRPAKIVFIS